MQQNCCKALGLPFYSSNRYKQINGTPNLSRVTFSNIKSGSLPSKVMLKYPRHTQFLIQSTDHPISIHRLYSLQLHEQQNTSELNNSIRIKLQQLVLHGCVNKYEYELNSTQQHPPDEYYSLLIEMLVDCCHCYTADLFSLDCHCPAMQLTTFVCKGVHVAATLTKPHLQL